MSTAKGIGALDGVIGGSEGSFYGAQLANSFNYQKIMIDSHCLSISPPENEQSIFLS